MLEALQAGDAYHATSLDAQRTETTRTATASATRSATTTTGFELAEHRALLGTVLAELAERDREILRLRFEEDLTQHEIAAARRRLADAGLAPAAPLADVAAHRGRAPPEREPALV